MKTSHKVVVGLSLILLGAACERAQDYPHITQDEVPGPKHEKLNYFWDERTELCFASATFVTAYGVRVTTFTNVPCTDKVWAVMKRK